MEVLQYVERNSIRLFEEAFDAFRKKKFATATFLAIFSVEEASKYVMLEKENRNPEFSTKKIYQHKVKHEEIGKFFWYWAIYSVLSKTFHDFKSFAENIPEIEIETLHFIQKLFGGDAVDFVRFNMFDNVEEMRAYVWEHFSHPELLKILENAKDGTVEKLRKKCIYVDLSEDRSTILSSPEEIVEEEANEWLKIAWFGQKYIKLSKKSGVKTVGSLHP